MSPLLFAAGDVGGARALLPIIALAAMQGLRPMVVRHGALVREPEVAGDWVKADAVRFADPSHRPSAYIFTGSVADPEPLRLARSARAAGIPTIFVLDSWSSYTARLTTDGLAPFLPDFYCVPDVQAKEDARRAGITAPIEVTGQPAFAGVVSEAEGSGLAAGPRARILMVSEPVEADHGRSRGYTETDVLTLIASALQTVASRVEIDLLPHPRDDAGRIAALWGSARGGLAGDVLGQNTLKSVGRYDGVAGMASVLIYRAWLLGRPALSCQPGLAMPALRQFGAREGIVLVDRHEGAAERIRAWAGGLVAGLPPLLRPEAWQHAKAAETILRIAQQSGMRAHDVQ